MKSVIAIMTTTVIFASISFAAEEQRSTASSTTVPKADDGKVEQYLKRRGESLERKMEDVMEPMKRGEGIRGATPSHNKNGTPAQSTYSSNRRR